MCGIVVYISGYSNGFSNTEVEAFTTMLFMDTLRGWDSTGVFSVSNKGNVSILKKAIDAPSFIKSKEYSDLCSDAVKNGLFLVGHNRAATRGVVKDENAHPFWVDEKIILVQNGTWFGDHKSVKNTEVDTEVIAHLLSDEADVGAALKKVNAAYALVWYNTETQTLYAIRNSLRPLYIARTKHDGVMLASEGATIIYAAGRANIELLEKPYEIKEEHLCEWKIENNSFDFTSKDIDCSFEHNKTNFPVSHYSPGGRHNFYGYGENGDDHVMSGPVSEEKREKLRLREVTNTIQQQIRLGRFKDWEVSSNVANELMNDLSIRPQQKELAIELIDYIPGNNQRDCEVFYLVGRPLTCGDKDPMPLVYCIYYGDETQALDMVTKQFFTIKCSFVANNEIFNTRTNVVSVFGFDIKDLQIAVNETKTA